MFTFACSIIVLIIAVLVLITIMNRDFLERFFAVVQA